MSDKIDAATASMIRNLEEKTGKPLVAWVELARASGLSKHGEIVKHLKTAHGLTHGYANLVAHEAISAFVSAPADEGDLVAAQYAGDKAGLRPIYDRLIAAVQAFGPDVEIAPKKAYVALRRSKQFAILQPSTKTRLDVGINLKGVDPEGRLEASGSWNSMVSHRVRVATPEDVDAALVGWLRQAYQEA
jgi:predicted transport protein